MNQTQLCHDNLNFSVILTHILLDHAKQCCHYQQIDSENYILEWRQTHYGITDINNLNINYHRYYSKSYDINYHKYYSKSYDINYHSITVSPTTLIITVLQ